MFPKSRPVRSESYRRWVASLPCLNCGIQGYSQCAHAIADIGMRMLQPRELYRAQGFPESYQIDRGADGRVLSKAAQVRMCGNSVCPPLARAIVSSNYADAAMRQAA